VCGGADDLACPEGFSCGVSGTCAQPGEKLSLAAELARGGDGVVIADFDADSVSDAAIASESKRSLGAVFLGRDLSIEEAFEFPIDSATMSVGNVDQDGIPDILIPSEAALFSLSSAPGERSLVGAAFTPSGYVFPDNNGRVVALPARAIPAADGQADVLQPDASVEGVLLNTANPTETGIYGINPYNLQQTEIAILPLVLMHEIAALIQAPLVPDRAEACDELLVLHDDRAVVVMLCSEPEPAAECPGCVFDIGLDGVVQAAAPMQRDADPELEVLLLVGEPGEAPSALSILERTGENDFGVRDASLPGEAWLDALHAVVGANDQAVLIVADINQDGSPDFVRADGVYLSNASVPFAADVLTPSYYRAAAPTSASGWSEVAVGDFDANGQVDVVASSASAGDDLDLLMNSGLSYFNPRALPASGSPGALIVGDFDGDGAADLVVRERSESQAGPPACTSPDDIVVRFGGSQGLGEPRVVARVAGVEQMTPGRLARLDKRDSIDDFGVASRCIPEDGLAVLSFGVFYGATNRQIAAPYRLVDEIPITANLNVIVPYVPEAFAVSARSQTTLAMAGRLPLGDTPGAYDLVLFALEGFQDKNKHVIPLPQESHEELTAAQVRVAIGDLDGAEESEGLEEIAIVDPLHLHVVDDWQSFPKQTSLPDKPVAPLLDDVRTTPLELGDDVAIEIVVAHDLDGDGAEELFVAGSSAAGPLLRYYSDLGAAQATPHDVTVSEGTRVIDLAFLPRHDDSGGYDVLIAVLGKGALSYRWDGSALVRADFEANLASIRALAVGDVDGDRFADLVLVAPDRTQIHTRRQRFVGGDPGLTSGGTP